jgi:hypothetical protein
MLPSRRGSHDRVVSRPVRDRLGGGRGARGSDGATDGKEVVDTVELDIEGLDLPLALDLGDLENGDTADTLLLLTAELLEGGVPDEGDAVAVPGAELLDDNGKVVGGVGLVVDERLLVEDGGAERGTVGDKGVDGVRGIQEVVMEVLDQALVPVAEHLDVGVDNLVDVALAEALLGLGDDGDVQAVALDGGSANSGGAGRGGEGEGGEETHLEG